MDPNLNQPSFIPKQALARTVPSARRSVGLLSVIALVILLLSLALLAGSYVFQKFLYQEINAECQLLEDGVTRVCGLRLSLEVARESLGESVLKKIERLDLKLQVINRLLAGHLIVTEIFEKILSPLTIQSIQYKKFTYRDGVASLEGIARSYKDVAVQANKFADERLIKNFIFSDLDLDNKGNIVFKLKLEFDPALTRYDNYLLIKKLKAPLPVLTPATTTPVIATSTLPAVASTTPVNNNSTSSPNYQ